MATSSNIYALLKYYSAKQRTAVVEFGEFVDYTRRYAQHHIEENPELSVYAGGSVDALQEELDRLSADHLIVLVSQGPSKQFIFVIAYYIDLYTESYREMEKNFSMPFPNMNDLPKNVPSDIVMRSSATDLMYRLLDEGPEDNTTLYCIQFNKGVPGLLLPSGTSMQRVIMIALKKLQDLLRKEESHDYFLKKLSISNPGKEISIKNFFSQFVAKPEEAWDSLRNTGDTFYYWNQLCYFIKQDYNKLKDFTTEDVNVLQSIGLIEVAASYYKSKASERIVREAAFKQLDEQLQVPPYYFSMDDIAKMKDKNGSFLLGKYTDEELKEHINGLTAETIGNSLPRALLFKVNEIHYIIFKERVMPLVVRLCNDARLIIKDSLSQVWFKYLLEFETLPEMKESNAFERCLERELKHCSPILYGLLNASFLPVLAFDDSTPGRFPLFKDGKILPYSELLLLSRQEIYADAKVKLPFWYSIPVVSWVISLIVRKPKRKIKKDSETSATARIIEEEKAKAAEKQSELDANDSLDPKKNRKRELRKAASMVESQIVPESSTLDRELDSYMQEWNDRISKKAHDDLTEDINVLIRDYTRKILRSLKTENFTAERVSSLAESLVDTPSLMKVKNHPALKRYIELYMVKLIKNLP